ncbi:acyl-CoA dehydrogenase [Hyphomonas sp.]|jgi:alkylation response protein AidB-like acyl-CoA dehydrogenase|uniref:acyl-CoA dehydrogenase n=1 Tax=Hyphomonas sp. TaxID=87 RepID=UPI0032D8CE4D
MRSDEQEQLDRTVRRLVSDRSAARKAAENVSGTDPDLLSELGALGLLAISLPSDMDGSELGLAEECIVVEALGEQVAPVPVVSIYLACHILSACPDATDVAAALANGQTVAGPLINADGSLSDVLIKPGNEGAAHLSSDVPFAFEGTSLTSFLVHADDAWWVVDANGPGVERGDLKSLDTTLPMARVKLVEAPAKRIGSFPPGDLQKIAQCLIAAEAVGVAQGALNLITEYALQREQFGQPIGRFQAIKQNLANCLLKLESGRSSLWGALRSVADGVPDGAASHLAKAAATEAATFVASESVQMHGAIGCTWEHDLHLLMRRSKHCEISFGSPASHLQRLGENALELYGAKRSKSGSSKKPEQDIGFVPSQADADFLIEFQTWLNEHAPPEKVSQLRRADLAGRRAWQAEMAEDNWAGIHWPVEYGGRAASFTQQVLYYAELTKRGVPPLPGNRGLMLVGPTLFTHGTDEQKKLLEPTRRADILWAGGFSERGAGSDLASLSTRAVVDDEKLVINGHKIWTSQAQYADWMYALVRTGSQHPKRDGISVVVFPMDTPGVEVRPIRRNNGDYHFNEVFFNDVTIPLSSVIGPKNAGWSVNRTTMQGEHLTNFLGAHASQARTIRRIAGMLQQREAETGLDVGLRQRFNTLWSTTQIIHLHGLRNVARFTSGADVGSESSITKIVGQENEKAMFEFLIDVMGSAGLEESIWTSAYLSTRASTIGGGTSEIHRNKLAERVLGMPRDLWADEEVDIAQAAE